MLTWDYEGKGRDPEKLLEEVICYLLSRTRVWEAAKKVGLGETEGARFIVVTISIKK